MKRSTLLLSAAALAVMAIPVASFANQVQSSATISVSPSVMASLPGCQVQLRTWLREQQFILLRWHFTHFPMSAADRATYRTMLDTMRLNQKTMIAAYLKGQCPTIPGSSSSSSISSITSSSSISASSLSSKSSSNSSNSSISSNSSNSSKSSNSSISSNSSKSSSSSNPQIPACFAKCPDGYLYRTCSESGHPIYYFVDPCLFHQAKSSSSSSKSSTSSSVSSKSSVSSSVSSMSSSNSSKSSISSNSSVSSSSQS